MVFLLGHMGLRPADAWAMTMIEYDATWRGYAEKHGIGRGPKPMTRSRLDELKALYPD